MIIGQITFISNGEKKTFKRKDGSGEVWVAVGYIDLGGLYPEKIEVFVNDASEILGRGEWIVPINVRLYNGRLWYDLEFKDALPVPVKTTTTTTNTTAKATA